MTKEQEPLRLGREQKLLNELFGHSLFTEQPEPLRSFNRAVMIGNMIEKDQKPMAVEYIEQFSDQDKAAVVAIQTLINKNGIDAVKKSVIAKIKWEDIE